MRLSLNLVIASTFGAVAPASANYDLDSLLEMPLCSLAETKVVSATRTSQSLADTPASVYVITAKEIKRSGARSVLMRYLWHPDYMSRNTPITIGV